MPKKPLQSLQGFNVSRETSIEQYKPIKPSQTNL